MSGAEDVGKTVTDSEPRFAAWKVAEDWEAKRRALVAEGALNGT